MDVQLFWLEILFPYLEILIGNFLYTGLRIELREVASKEAVLGKNGALNARLLKWICSGILSIYTSAASVRQNLPHLVDLIWNRKIDPGKVFDLTLPLAEVAEGYRAMDERRAIKTLLQV